MLAKLCRYYSKKNGKFDGHIGGKTPYMQSAYVTDADKSLIGKIMNIKITQGSAISVTGFVL